jgi:hypothetical protein
MDKKPKREKKMIEHPAFRIRVLVNPDGEIRTTVESEHGETPVQGLIFYHRLEPAILKFKKSIKRAISAYYGQGNKTKGAKCKI